MKAVAMFGLRVGVPGPLSSAKVERLHSTRVVIFWKRFSAQSQQDAVLLLCQKAEYNVLTSCAISSSSSVPGKCTACALQCGYSLNSPRLAAD